MRRSNRQRFEHLADLGALRDHHEVEALLDVHDADEAEDLPHRDQSQLIWRCHR